MQWKTVGATLAIFAGVIALFYTLVSQAKFISHNSDFLNGVEFAIFLTVGAAILILIIFQFWQATESRKISDVTVFFSNIFKHIRHNKSEGVANITRYLLLVFMIGIIVICAVLTKLSLAKLATQYVRCPICLVNAPLV